MPDSFIAWARRAGSHAVRHARLNGIAGLYGRMPGVAFEDYPAARLIVLWGVNPAVTGIHLAPFIEQAQANGARLAVVDPRRTPFARQADLHLPLRPGSDLPVALAIIRWLFDSGQRGSSIFSRCMPGTGSVSANAARHGRSSGPRKSPESRPRDHRPGRVVRRFAPAVIRCGWGIERNQNGGSAIAAVLALPAVAGKFGVPAAGTR